MHNNEFDILLRCVHYSAKLQVAKSPNNAPKIKCYRYKATWDFELSYKLYLAQDLQLCLGTPHLFTWAIQVYGLEM